MKKIIDIPDEIVKELKILAIKNDSNLKNYIEELVSNHYQFSNITELADYAQKDGQAVRSIWNYLVQTYNGLENHKFGFDETSFRDLTEFLQFVKYVCDWAINSIKIDENGMD